MHGRVVVVVVACGVLSGPAWAAKKNARSKTPPAVKTQPASVEPTPETLPPAETPAPQPAPEAPAVAPPEEAPASTAKPSPGKPLMLDVFGGGLFPSRPAYSYVPQTTVALWRVGARASQSIVALKHVRIDWLATVTSSHWGDQVTINNMHQTQTVWLLDVLGGARVRYQPLPRFYITADASLGVSYVRLSALTTFSGETASGRVGFGAQLSTGVQYEVAKYVRLFIDPLQLRVGLGADSFGVLTAYAAMTGISFVLGEEDPR